MQRVVSGIRRRGVDVGRLRGLSVFAGTGERTDRHFAPLLASLEVWEIDPNHEPALRRNLPSARVKITDSYEEIRQADQRFGFIVLDSPASPYGGHSEHFDLFPALFRVVGDDAVVVIHVIPEADARTRRGYPSLFNDVQLDHRRLFYGTDHPERIPLEQLASHYRGLFRENGFTSEWHFFVRRWERRHLIPMPVSMYYLVLKVRRKPSQAGEADRASG